MPLTRPLILASASPRRAELLTQIGLPFDVQVAHAHEAPPQPAQDILDWARQTAIAKARAVAETLPAAPVLILSADTVVLLPHPGRVDAPQLYGQGVEVLGKPRDINDAVRMLHALSGREHAVVSAFALLAHPENVLSTGVEITRVQFRTLSPEEIAAYVASGEPLDKAGGYGIQGFGAVLIEKILGDYYTVVGLPLAKVWEALAPWRQS